MFCDRQRLQNHHVLFFTNFLFYDCQTLQIIMFRSSKIFCDHQFFKHNVIWLPNTTKSNVQLFTNCVLWLKIIASLVHAHEFYFTMVQDLDVQIFPLLAQILILSRTRTTCPPYSCPSNSRSSSRLPRENTTVKKYFSEQDSRKYFLTWTN